MQVALLAAIALSALVGLTRPEAVLPAACATGALLLVAGVVLLVPGARSRSAPR